MDTFVIETVEQLKVFADPLRQQIFQAMCCEPVTTKQVAEQLGEKPTRLYHHVDLLEKAGFIKVVEEKRNRGTIEKYYLGTAHKIVIGAQAMGGEAAEPGSMPEMQQMFVQMLQAGLSDARKRFVAVPKKDKEATSVAARCQMKLSDSQLAEFEEMIDRWLEENQTAEDDARLHSITIALFPIE